MKRSDFPDNCEFVIKEGDRPFIIIRGEGVFSFESGRRSPARSSCNLGSAWRNVPFERWASLVEDIKSGKVVP